MLRGAIIGTGFWSNFQIPAWQEIADVQLVAVCDQSLSKAQETARKFGIPKAYGKAEELLANEQLDFVDIITDVDTHAPLTRLAAQHQVHVICQKPMATTVSEARQMVDTCSHHGVQLYIHENFRWQAPMRALHRSLQSGIIGIPFKARIAFCSAFPVYDNQPSLKNLQHFIITDVGSHVLDICRFLFGEVKSLYCITQRVNSEVRGEDVANVLLQMESGMHCFVEMSYASILKKEAFPQTLVLVEGTKGSLHLTHDFTIETTTRDKTITEVIKPPLYPWIDPQYAVAHSSIVDCNRNILLGLQGGKAETTGDDNFKTTRLVWTAYESAATGKNIEL